MKTREDVNKMTPDELVSWFLISSCAYYRLGKKVMLDTDFDHLVERLKLSWSLSSHPHKALIKQTHLDSASGFDIVYPLIVIHSTNLYLTEIQ